VPNVTDPSETIEPPGWASSIADLTVEWVDPTDLLAHPLNARRHPGSQRVTLRESLETVGWVDPVKVSRRTGRVVDGHARVEEAISAGAPVPVLYLDLDEEQERRVLATLDPIAGLAVYDAEVLGSLLDALVFESDETRGMLDGLAEEASLLAGLGDGLPGGSGGAPSTGPSLSERFGAPPFSVLDARQGYWQSRKREWLSLGIESERGRPNLQESADQSSKNRNRTPQHESGRDPGFYALKRAAERSVGRTLSNAEFIADHYAGPPTAPYASGTSVFDPVLCELVYRWFVPPGGAILDPFAGGSVRAVVAARLNHPYTGIELRAEQVAANREQLRIAGDPPPEWIEGDSLTVLPTIDHTYDLVFSCPPYGDLEIYSDDPADISNMGWDDFLAAYRAIIAASVDRLADDRYAVFVVGDLRDRTGQLRGLPEETTRAFVDAGARLYNDAVLLTAIGSLAVRAPVTFKKSRKLGRTHQYVLVYAKGDPRAAADACGEVDLPDLAPFITPEEPDP
jgi:hypothetical protein